ncbi:serine hydrolase domain-containing protein [Ottowia thiooxydans]|uniref:CubicO group peptidase (Beta-lactamase class C family) n=1 Tax=Ottowia thiooxydans TaxID=219182 RepID=A0ABV2Q4T8_9BURK
MATSQWTALLKNRLATSLVSLFFLSAATGAHSQSVFPDTKWLVSSEADQAPVWSSEKFKLADEYAASIRSDAYLVIHRGRLVHTYGDITQPMNLASVRKSVLSILYGIYVDRGRIDLNESLADLNITDKGGLSATERTATVRQLLQGRSGVYHPAAYETAEAKKERPARGSHAPGQFWYYNNWDFNTLGTIFQQKTGKSVYEAFKADLADPLQLEDFRYPEDLELVYERASDHPAYVMKLSARDLARIGLLVSRGGQWRGKDIVSSNWLQESTTAYSTVGRGLNGYGYMWWVPQKAFPFWRHSGNQLAFAVGTGGQFMLIDRVRDIVIVHRVNNGRPWFMRYEVTGEQFAQLAARILAAAPEEVLRLPSP